MSSIFAPTCVYLGQYDTIIFAMELYKRNNVWWVSWYTKGIRHRKSLGKYTQKEAKKVVAGLNLATEAPIFDKAVEILRLFYADESNATPLDSVWDKYIEMAHAIGKDEVQESTMNHRRQHLTKFIEWLKDRYPRIKLVETVDAKISAEYASHLSSLKNSKGEPLAKKTRKEHIDDLKSVWKMLAKVADMGENPWNDLSPSGVSISSIRREEFTQEQEKRVFDAARKVGKNWYLACLIARHTGLRYGDVANLPWEEVDLDNGVIHHKPRKTIKHNIVVHIPLVKTLWSALKEAKKQSADPYILPNHHAMYKRDNKARQRLLAFREVLDLAGITDEQYTFHSWRHTEASRLAEAGADKEVRKSILGHTTDEMAEHYNHSQNLDKKRNALEKAAR